MSQTLEPTGPGSRLARRDAKGRLYRDGVKIGEFQTVEVDQLTNEAA